MSELVIGEVKCKWCGAPAQAIYDGETLHITCDVCGYEMWGEAEEDD